MHPVASLRRVSRRYGHVRALVAAVPVNVHPARRGDRAAARLEWRQRLQQRLGSSNSVRPRGRAWPSADTAQRHTRFSTACTLSRDLRVICCAQVSARVSLEG
ncbi:hypothetical protein [Verminephrobacter aporrectodeae]|uniref:hypothetical protein n=1 Tax=Verminephrobacter aporrectodeae TaxID=1110389 RepID=UPI0022391033|nr:hypothetical protein [Verminephrobacter aporrectodeae]